MLASEPQKNQQRGELFAVACPSRKVLQNVTSRWGVLVLVALMSGTYRFSELRRKIGGVSEKMLAQTLQALEADGFVLRTAFPVVPPHVEYSLTRMGHEVAHEVESLADWIEGNLYRIMQQRRANGPVGDAERDLASGTAS
ncbi:MAG: helix-turn-helix domain-containing protein [Burkholderiaceae bacterium]